MKNKTIYAFSLIVAFIFFSSCKQKDNQKEKNEAIASADAQELKEFMLAGPYFMQDFGGVDGIEKMIPNTGDTDEMITKYRDVFLFPFTPAQANETKNIFSTMWNVNSKADLDAVMTKLLIIQDPQNPHKAWDYARVVNNACLGYSAGYLTKTESEKYINNAFQLAQKEFKTWSDYFTDFNAGRNTWDPDSNEKAMYDKMIVDLTKNPDGIYALLPLN